MNNRFGVDTGLNDAILVLSSGSGMKQRRLDPKKRKQLSEIYAEKLYGLFSENEIVARFCLEIVSVSVNSNMTELEVRWKSQGDRTDLVSVNSNMTELEVRWKSQGDQTDLEVQEALEKAGNSFRSDLSLSMYNAAVPPLKFVADRSHLIQEEMNQLFVKADYGMQYRALSYTGAVLGSMSDAGTPSSETPKKRREKAVPNPSCVGISARPAARLVRSGGGTAGVVSIDRRTYKQQGRPARRSSFHQSMYDNPQEGGAGPGIPISYGPQHMFQHPEGIPIEGGVVENGHDDRPVPVEHEELRGEIPLNPLNEEYQITQWGEPSTDDMIHIDVVGDVDMPGTSASTSAMPLELHPLIESEIEAFRNGSATLMSVLDPIVEGADDSETFGPEEEKRRRLAEAKRLKRASLSEDQLAALREREKNQARKRRERMSEDQKVLERARNAARKRLQRSMMTDEQITAQRRIEAQRQRERRMRETEDQRNKRRQIEAARVRERRLHENYVEREVRRMQEASRQRTRRSTASFKTSQQQHAQAAHM
uniref:HORMA domain-containing protein n=1 Tax=Steinernema glaseri TaxID=37863 RepID=A0A1I8AJ63_9BILA